MAQPVFNFRRVINNWPTIELYFTMGCQGQPVYNMTTQNFEIYENGVRVPNFQLWCPDPNAKCPVSIALILDATGSMMGQLIRDNITLGNELVANLDGVTDEACVFKISGKSGLVQRMTTFKTKLYNAVAGIIPAVDSSNIWDVTYESINEMYRSATNTCRGIILITDGEDNASIETPKSVINLANRNRIRIYTVGVGNLAGATELQTIAAGTGGMYFEAKPGAGTDVMGLIYQSIGYSLVKGYQECRLDYDAMCGDGTKRTVDLVVKNFCGGGDRKTKTYDAVVDSTTFSDLHISLGSATLKANQDVSIPLTLDDAMSNENLYPSTFTIQIANPSCGLQFKKIVTPPGSLLQGMLLNVTPSGNTITVRTEKRIINGSGLLAEIVFRTGDPTDTCCTDIRLANWTIDQGCRKPVLSSGRICTIPMKPIVECTNTAPEFITWDPFAKDYTPNPFVVSMQVMNIGDRDAKNARFKIIYNPADVTLAGPMTDVITPRPGDLVQGGGVLEAAWNLRAKLRMASKEIEVCIIASFDNYPDVICCSKIKIPPSGPIISCDITSPPIKADKAQQRYNPMPFEISMTMRNDGGTKTDTVWATIIVPPDLVLSGPDSPNRHTKRVATTVLPLGQATVKWEVKHPITIAPVDYTVVVWVKTSNADSTMCEHLISIPALDAPVLKAQCFVPDSLHYDEASSAYTPDPFDVSVECKNIGGLTAESVTGFLYLPANVVLADPLDSLRKTFNPSTMDPYKPGQPVSRLTWRVKYTKKFRFTSQLDFKFVTGGITTLGIKTDSSETWCSVRVPGLAPAFDCSITLPDSCAANSVGSDVTPNPFTLEYRVWNTSKLPATISTATVSWPAGMGVQLEPPTQPVRKLVNKLLNPNETLLVTWTFRIENRITRRDVAFNVVAVDEDGSPVRACGDHLPIANLSTALVCNLQTTASTLVYGQGTPGYTPTQFVMTGLLENTGGAPLHNSWARIEKNDPLDLIEFDPTYVDPDYASNDTMRVYGYLDVAKSKSASWGFRLKQPNRTDSAQFVTFDLRYKSTETPEVTGVCTQVVEVQPVRTSKLACTLIAPDTIRFIDNYYSPSPFDLRIRIENQSSGDAINVKAFVLQSTRFTVIPPSFFSIDTMHAGETLEPFGNPGFKLLTNPRSTDGFDTLRVAIAADGIPSTLCEYPVFVMHEQRPKLSMVCTATPNTLTFDDQTFDYVPNPFTITTNVQNIGEAKAEQCQVAFIGPPRFTLERLSPIEMVGTLTPGQQVATNWQVRALCHPQDGWDTLYFQVQGRGGLNDNLVTDTCRALVYIPACRTPEYTIKCEQLRQFTFDANTGVYVPSFVMISDTIINTGQADGIGLQATIFMPPGIYLAAGEDATKALPTLPKGQSAILNWEIHPIARANDTTLTVSIVLTDRTGKATHCDLAKIFVPRASSFALLCNPSNDPARFPDSLAVDKVNGVYAGGPLFPAAITVTNSGQRPVDSVYVLMIAESNDVVINGQPLQFVSPRLDPGASVPVQWQWSCKPRQITSDVVFRFVVTGKSSVSSECVKGVHIPLIGKPNLDILFTTIPGDTLHFNSALADYEGTVSPSGNYNVFTVTARAQNLGAAQADSMKATILPPAGVTLDVGETAIKAFTPASIPVGSQGSVSWKFKPVRQNSGASRVFETDITSGNAGSARMSTKLFIQGGPLEATMRIPQDNVGRFGDVIIIPLEIGPSIGRNIFSYRANIMYDPEIIRFQKVDNVGSMTEVGWNNLSVSEFTPSSLPGKAVVRITDATPGSLLYSRDSGALAYMYFECMYNKDQMNYVQSPLDLIDFTPDGSTEPLVTSFNGTDDTHPGNVLVRRESGLVTVSGECITPLNSGLTYQLKQNKPNPFNPTTTIEYEIPEETTVRINIFDQLGRQVRTYSQGRMKAGRYSLLVDASDLPSGIYTYTLETPSFVRSMRMTLAR